MLKIGKTDKEKKTDYFAKDEKKMVIYYKYSIYLA